MGGSRASWPAWVIGTLRRELLDRILTLSERHVALVLREYLIHYNGHRPHQARQQRPPDTATQSPRDVTDLNDPRSIRRKPVVAGMISEYHPRRLTAAQATDSIFERHTLARRLQTRAPQVWRFTVDFAVPFTNNPRRAAPAHGQTPDEDRRLLAQRPHRRPLLPHPLLPRHRPQPRHPPARCPPRRLVRKPLDATTKRLINHRREWIPTAVLCLTGAEQLRKEAAQIPNSA
ncbi:transposase [Nonomuraea basaltis]|nr:transposase [Nonomuraea basaltis]